jgi:hypothetical protein
MEYISFLADGLETWSELASSSIQMPELFLRSSMVDLKPEVMRGGREEEIAALLCEVGKRKVGMRRGVRMPLTDEINVQRRLDCVVLSERVTGSGMSSW